MVHPNSLKALEPFRRGHDPRRDTRGRRPGSTTIKEWWNTLLAEDSDGIPKYTLQDIRSFTDAPDDDPAVSPAKRIAARHILEMEAGGRTGRELTALMFDRTEGKAAAYLTLTAESADLSKRVVLVHKTELDAQEAARLLPSSELDDEQAVDL